jgi:hypothetical protein
MRPIVLATIPLLAALTAIPATAQVRAEVRLGIPIGNHQVVVTYRPERMPREVRIYDYDRRDYGDWNRDRDYRRWQPITVYFYAGRYYERPFRYARPVVIYRYRDRYFFPPRDGRWERAYGRDNDWGRGYDRDRDDRYGRDRDDRNDRDRDDRYNDRGDRNQNDRGVPPIRGGRSRP